MIRDLHDESRGKRPRDAKTESRSKRAKVVPDRAIGYPEDVDMEKNNIMEDVGACVTHSRVRETPTANSGGGYSPRETTYPEVYESWESYFGFSDVY